jgi:tetratricopeptide (TPR) repeat protein
MPSFQYSKSAVIWILLGTLVCAQHAIAAVADATELLRKERYQTLDSDYSAIQRKFERGDISGEDLRDAFREFYPTDRDLASKLDGWVNAFPKSYVARLARGMYYKKLGFEERGSKYISETSAAQLHNMDTALGKAIKDFGDSITMNPKPFLSYFHMIDIGRAYAGPSYTRALFDHALDLEPRSFALRQKFMLALEAKWGGSLEEMNQFLEECRRADLPTAQFRQLQSMVYENIGWERENHDGDHAAAEAAYRKAIELGSADCTSCLISALTTILIEERKFGDALPLLDRYLEGKPGDTWALGTRGFAYFESGKPVDAFADWRVSATAGDAFSQNRLGVLYMTGIPGHMAQDPKTGIDWLRKSADQGNAEAQHNLPLAVARNASQKTASP